MECDADLVGWIVVRQDEHGSKFEVARFRSKRDADQAVADFETGYPHHQSYFVVPVAPPTEE